MKRKSRILLAALCAAALVLLSLLAFAGCGAAKDSAYVEEMEYNRADAADTAAVTKAYGASGYAQDAAAAPAPSEAAAADDAQMQEKIVRTFDLTVQTETFDKYVAALKAAVTAAGGYLEECSVENGGYSARSDRWASIIARVPTAQAETFLAAAGKNGVVLESTETATNVTLQYVDLESRIKAYRTEQTTLLGLLEKADSLENTLKIQERLSEINYQLENYTAQLRVLENRVSYSTVTIDVQEVNRALAQADGLGTRIKNRFFENWDALVDGLKNFVVGLVGGLPILLPLAAVIAAAVIVLVKARKKRKAKKAAKQAENKTE